MEISRKDLLKTNEALEQLGQTPGLSVGYQVAKNLRRCEKEVAKTREKVAAIRNSFAMKHPDGRFIFKGNEITGRQELDFGVNKEKADDAIEALNNEKVNVDFHAIKDEEFPFNEVPALISRALMGTVLADVE